MRIEFSKGERASNRMLKKSASGVLTSLRDSTYRSVRLASSLAAALLNSLFEHPEVTLKVSGGVSLGSDQGTPS
jgi:hypothetical protein